MMISFPNTSMLLSSRCKRCEIVVFLTVRALHRNMDLYRIYIRMRKDERMLQNMLLLNLKYYCITVGYEIDWYMLFRASKLYIYNVLWENPTTREILHQHSIDENRVMNIINKPMHAKHYLIFYEMYIY